MVIHMPNFKKLKNILQLVCVFLGLRCMIAPDTWGFAPEEKVSFTRSTYLQLPAETASLMEPPFSPSRTRLAQWEEFQRSAGPGWSIQWNALTGITARIAGSKLATDLPLNPSDQVLTKWAREFVNRFPSLLGVKSDSLSALSVTRAGKHTHLSFAQTQQGLPVYGAYLKLSLNRKNELVRISSTCLPEAACPAGPILPQSVAVQKARAFFTKNLPRSSDSSSCLKEIKPVLYPLHPSQPVEFRRCYFMQLHLDNPLGDWIVVMDASSGQVFTWYNNYRFGEVRGAVKGEILPAYDQDATAMVPFKNETIHVVSATPAYSWNMESNPGWQTTSTEWAWGVPNGQGGDAGDFAPHTGHTGSNVYAYNLAGGYIDDLTPAQFLITASIDCSQLTNTHLVFWRWLGVEAAGYDQASIEASTNGVNWTPIWRNLLSSSLMEHQWTQVVYDLSAIADRQPNLQIRWGMGPTNWTHSFAGWYLDDVAIYAGGGAELADEQGNYKVEYSGNDQVLVFSELSGPYQDVYYEDGPRLSYHQDNSSATQNWSWQTPSLAVIQLWNLETNPGWSTQGDWAFGAPLGIAGDPTSGHTGSNVYGNNLSGKYADNIPETCYLTTTPFDCAGFQSVFLSFWRFAGLDFWGEVYAGIEASHDGTNWEPIWRKGQYLNVNDTVWTHCTYDLSPVAAGQPAVYVRWGLGPSKPYRSSFGWNLDDIEILGATGIAAVQPGVYGYDEVNVFHHINVVRDYIKKMDPAFTGMDYKLPAVVRVLDNYANAFWDGEGLNFGEGDGAYLRNLALFADVIYHEFNHGITHHIYPPPLLPYTGEPGALDEAWSDYFACDLTGEPLIGEGGLMVTKPFMRNLENTLRIPDNWQNEVHADGRIAGGAMWDLRRRLGSPQASPLLHFAKYAQAETFFDYYEDLLTTDDDDGSFQNGTPNMSAIAAAFGKHGIGGLQLIGAGTHPDHDLLLNGKVDAGEAGALMIICNSFLVAPTMEATLVSGNPYVSINDGLSVLGQCAYNEQKDNTLDPFHLSLNPQCPYEEVLSMTVTLSAAGGYASSQVLSLVNAPDQIIYEDGSPNIYFGYGMPGGMFATRFTPESYPLTITAARLNPCPEPPGIQILLQAWDDDGPNGAPGTVLFSKEVVTTASAAWNEFSLAQPLLQDVYTWDMESNPAWNAEGLWAYGLPAGQGGENGNSDPNSGKTGQNVCGYNLAGDYPNRLDVTEYLTTSAINCAGLRGVQLAFQRWLNAESRDYASLEVSADGSSWTNVWTNTDYVGDSTWTKMLYDISAVADNQPAVFVRWGIGPTSYWDRYSGWNIDDVQILAALGILTGITVSSGDIYLGWKELSETYFNGVCRRLPDQRAWMFDPPRGWIRLDTLGYDFDFLVRARVNITPTSTPTVTPTGTLPTATCTASPNYTQTRTITETPTQTTTPHTPTDTATPTATERVNLSQSLLRNGDFESGFHGLPGERVGAQWEIFSIYNCHLHRYNSYLGPYQQPESEHCLEVSHIVSNQYNGIYQNVAGLIPGGTYSFSGYYRIHNPLGFDSNEHPAACAMRLGISAEGDMANLAHVTWGAPWIAEMDGWTKDMHDAQTYWFQIPPVVSPPVPQDGKLTVIVTVYNGWEPACLRDGGWGAGKLYLDNFTLAYLGGNTPAVSPTRTPTPTETEAPNLGEKRLEIQAVEVIQSVKTGNMVAGKNTVVRAFLISKERNAISGVRGTLYQVHDGQEELLCRVSKPVTAVASTAGGLADLNNEQNSLNFYFDAPAQPGQFAFKVVIDPPHRGDPNVSQTYDFVERARPNVLVQALSVGGKEVAKRDLLSMLRLAKSMFPIADLGYLPSLVPSAEEQAAQISLAQALAKWAPRLFVEKEIFNASQTVFPADLIVGVVPDGALGGALSAEDFDGLAVPAAKVALVEARRDGEESLGDLVFAHEAGHILGVRHDDSPRGSGVLLSTPETVMIEPLGNRCLTITGAPLGSVNALMLKGEGLEGKLAWPSWINQPDYESLFATLAPSHHSKLVKLASNTEYFTVMANLNLAGAVDVLVSFKQAGPAQLSEFSGGPYSLVFLNAQRPVPAVLSEHFFNVDFESSAVSDIEMETIPLGLTDILPEGAASAQIRKDGLPRANIPFSANPPVVTVIAPNGGESLNGATQIQWSVSDPDHDSLTFNIYYSPDGGAAWLPVGMNLAETALTWDTNLAPGAQNGLIQVVAGDGYNRGSDVSGATFTVAFKPPTAVIISPTDMAQVVMGQVVNLIGVGFDPEDGALGGESLSWSSDLGGLLGTGTVASATLAAGTHQITLQATDSNGQTGVDTITLAVIADRDGDGLPDAYEIAHPPLNPDLDDSQEDPDHDGLPNQNEYFHGTKPDIADTDQGGINDGDEVRFGRNPLNPSDDTLPTPAPTATTPTPDTATPTPAPTHPPSPADLNEDGKLDALDLMLFMRAWDSPMLTPTISFTPTSTVTATVTISPTITSTVTSTDPPTSTPVMTATPTFTSTATPISTTTFTVTTTATRTNTSTPPPAATPTLVDVNTLPLFNQAKAADPDRYNFAVEKGAQFIPTSDGRSFYVLWTPAGFDQAALRPMIATIHGHASWAFDEFFLWQPYAQARGYGVIALQWWFGGGEALTDYYLPKEMYPIFDHALRNLQIEPGKVLFHGFSRGSANTYATTVFDWQTNRFFGLTLSNSGGAAEDFPPNVDIINGKFGPMPLAGAHWAMYCGEQDPNPDQSGCPGMQAASAFVVRYGAVVDLFIQDPDGDHGGFHLHPANVNMALDVFDGLLGGRR